MIRSTRLPASDHRLFTLDVFLISGDPRKKFGKKKWNDISRVIQIRGDQTLNDLHEAIFIAFDRYDEHLYEFQIGGRAPFDPNAWRYSPPVEFGWKEPTNSADTAIGKLGLKRGDKFGYWFDFGDDWWHQIDVLEIDEHAPEGELPRIVQRQGESPPQYEVDVCGDDAEGEPPPSLEEVLASSSPKYRARYVEISQRCDDFCKARLNSEYQAVCASLLEIVCQFDLPIDRGKPESWAAGLVHSVGWVNFLFDPTQQPHLKPEEVAAGFGVSVATMQTKSRDIRKRLNLVQLDPEFCLPSKLDDNPLVWLIEVQGLMLDARQAPREIQQRLWEEGIIPYVPADRHSQDSNGGPKQ